MCVRVCFRVCVCVLVHGRGEPHTSQTSVKHRHATHGDIRGRARKRKQDPANADGELGASLGAYRGELRAAAETCGWRRTNGGRDTDDGTDATATAPTATATATATAKAEANASEVSKTRGSTSGRDAK